MKPILFNTEMVRAILDGRKTQTRRVVKERILDAYYDYDDYCTSVIPTDVPCSRYYEKEFFLEKCAYRTGDILYVREAFCPNYFEDLTPAYKADYYKEHICDVVPEPKWRPSIHMPKAAARLFLKVTDVRVERLQKISREDAISEGAYGGIDRHDPLDDPNLGFEIEDFVSLWDSTIKPKDLVQSGWEANPWVWVIAFERCEKPEVDRPCKC